MEKMNQVSVSEFFAKSKEEMYDMAVDMVEKYNRLIDICNDSCERISEVVIERDNLSKGVQKLIGERDELIERHNVYTSALNKDIADKAAKIELLEKEIEGRKEGYTALKKRMDTDYISIEEHNNIVDPLNKEIERLNRYSKNLETANHNLVTRVALLEPEIENFKKELDAREKEIMELNIKIRHQRENLDGINKTLEIRTKENEELHKKCFSKSVDYRELEEKYRTVEQYNKDLKEKNEKLKRELDSTIESASYWQGEAKKLENYVTDLKKKFGDSRKETIDRNVTIVQLEGQIKNLEKELEGYKVRDENAKGLLNNNTKEIMELKKAIVKLKDKNSTLEKTIKLCGHEVRFYKDRLNTLYEEKMEMEGDHGRKGFKEYIKWIVKEEEAKYKESWKARLNKEITAIFEKEEETEVKGRYPWGAKVRCKKPDGIYCSYSDECHRKPENFNCDFKDDIPCGSDSIE